MKIVEPYIIIESSVEGDSILRQIEKIGRTAYKSEDKITQDSAKDFVSMIIERGHFSVIEHQSITVRVICDRGVSHEIVRHRLASYTQESTRYCNYSIGKFGSEITVIKPCFWEENDEKYLLWKEAMIHAEKTYNKLIKLGADPQEARSVLPNSLKTEIVMTMNLREWRHFFKLRTSEAAHPQMREIAVPLLKEFQKRIPIIFDDLKEIMVIDRDILFSKGYFYGFSIWSDHNFESHILNHFTWRQRGASENNCLYKQPIGYIVIYNPSLGKIFVFKRSKKRENYQESRLQGMYSIGVGGHIDRGDASSINPISSSVLREIREEVGIVVPDDLKIFGYINNEDKVGSVHFGILYIVEINTEEITPVDPEIAKGKLLDITEFEQICKNPDEQVEEWAKIALGALKQYIGHQ